jgi:hypothetical protein
MTDEFTVGAEAARSCRHFMRLQISAIEAH